MSTPLTVADEHRPQHREVGLEHLRRAGAYPDGELLTRIVSAAQSGALVAIVVNLVDDAQRLARTLRERTRDCPEIAVDIFHARYRFIDRQDKEAAVLKHYGREAPRTSGRILVATQVVEQSLDLDFDWLITQICPVDLLFQRLGRLHRHQRDQRPLGFETPHCTVLTVERDDYGVFELIYGNARVLWRTDALLNQQDSVVFPEAYRDWIEKVYDPECADDESEKVIGGYLSWKQGQASSTQKALQLTTMPWRTFRDQEGEITSLTRDGEMSLSVLPLNADGCLLDGSLISGILEQVRAEVINLNTIPVPASWRELLRACAVDSEGLLAGCHQLLMSTDCDGGRFDTEGKFRYSADFGLEKVRRDEPA